MIYDNKKALATNSKDKSMGRGRGKRIVVKNILADEAASRQLQEDNEDTFISST